MLRFPQINKCADLAASLGGYECVLHGQQSLSVSFHIVFCFAFLRQRETTTVCVWCSLLARTCFSSSVRVGLTYTATHASWMLWYTLNMDAIMKIWWFKEFLLEKIQNNLKGQFNFFSIDALYPPRSLSAQTKLEEVMVMFMLFYISTCIIFLRYQHNSDGFAWIGINFGTCSRINQPFSHNVDLDVTVFIYCTLYFMNLLDLGWILSCVIYVYHSNTKQTTIETLRERRPLQKAENLPSLKHVAELNGACFWLAIYALFVELQAKC